jgi:VanZ family protein
MNTKVLHFFKYQFPAIAWACLIYFASSIPGPDLPDLFLLDYDKLIHIGIFFVFGFLAYRALEPYAKTESFNWKRVTLAVIIVVAYGTIDELHQGSVPGRTLDVFDLLADTIGGILSGGFAYVYFHWTEKRLTTIS